LSTYYDLKHLRSSLETFIEQLGYEPILSEKDTIAFTPDIPLDESCYREAKSSDIYVLIIGGRYGSEISATKQNRVAKKDFYERYDSITKHEYLSALEKGIPIYICIDASVDAEYHTFQKNRTSNKISYAHVDSVNIFHLIEFIRDQQKNNPIKLFSKYSEIERWLSEQWAGFFRELIQRMSEQKQLTDINTRINDLMQTTETLKRYLEEVVSKVSDGSKSNAEELIKRENERLKQALEESEFSAIGYINHLIRNHQRLSSDIRSKLSAAKTYKEFIQKLFGNEPPQCCAGVRAFEEINQARRLIDRLEFSFDELDLVNSLVRKVKVRTDHHISNVKKN